MLKNLSSYFANIKNFFAVREFYCVECEAEKKIKYCKHCQKETGNLFKFELSETVTVGESIGIKQKRPSIKKYIKEVFWGYQPSTNKKKHPEGVERHTSIDRENDQYDKTDESPTSLRSGI